MPDCLSLEAIFEELFVTRGNKVAQETGSDTWRRLRRLEWCRGEQGAGATCKYRNSPESDHEMASSGRVTPQIVSSKRGVHIMQRILPPPTRPLSNNGRGNIQ